MADDNKGATIIQAGAKGGVSAVMPYVAIGVIGYLGLRELKKLDFDIGFDPNNIAGSIIDSAGDAAGDVVNYITEKAGETVIFITETRDDIVETAKVETSITSREEQGQPWSLTPESTKQLHKYKGTPGNVVSNWLAQIAPDKIPTGVLSEFKGTTQQYYGDYGPDVPKSKYIPIGLSGLSSAYVPETKTKSSGSGTGRATLGPVKPLSSASKESQKVVKDYQSYVSAGGTRAPYAHKPDMKAKPTKDWKVVK